MTISAVGVFSIARRNRNHQDETMRRSVAAGTSQRLRATNPNPPACRIKSTALKASSRLWSQRIQRSRLKSTPAFAADERSNVSSQSISAQISSWEDAADSAESMRLVRPDEAAPWISVIAPRGKPCKASSISLSPVETVSAGKRSYRSKIWPNRFTRADSISCLAALLVAGEFMIR